MEDTADKSTSPDHGASARTSKRALWILAAGALILAVLGGAGILQRQSATNELRKTAEAAEQHVIVTHPSTSPTATKLVLPGQTEAYTQAPIFAQTNGYLSKWYFDIGARVKQGDVLGMIETPTVDQQLAQAQAQLAESQAALKLAQATYARQQALLAKTVISQQDFDDATSNLQTQQSSVTAGIANVNNLKAQQAFNILRAPFDGILSARNTDIGALVKSDDDTPLFVVSKISPLRIYVQVPESLAAQVKKGTKADLTFDTFPGRKFPAEVVATAGVIDASSRTLLTQLSVPNDNEELFPGAYTQVHLLLENPNPSLSVPANVLLFRSEGAAVGVVDASGKVEIRNIKIGRDFGNTLEILGGLNPTDQIIVNPPDSLNAGDVVKTTEAPAESPPAKPKSGS